MADATAYPSKTGASALGVSGTPSASTEDLYTYNHKSSYIAIPDVSTVTSIIDVPDTFKVLDVDVGLDITHPETSNLDIAILHGGTRVWLATDLGGGGEDYTDTIFDDEAATSIESGSPPFTGSFNPEGAASLSNLDGVSAAGDWTLEVTDDQAANTGTLNNWELYLRGNKNVRVSTAADTLVLSEIAATVVYDVTVTGVTDSLTITEQTASVANDVTITGVTDSLTITNGTASIANDATVTGVTDSLTITGVTASVANDVTITGVTDSLTLTAGTASVANDVTVTGAAASLTITGGTASLSEDVLVTGVTDSLTITGVTASVANDVTVTGAAASLTIAGGTASLSEDTLITGVTDSLTITGVTANVINDVTVTGVAASLTITGGTASLSEDTLITGVTDSLTITELVATFPVSTTPSSVGASAISVSGTPAVDTLINVGMGARATAKTTPPSNVSDKVITATPAAIVITGGTAIVGLGITITSITASLTITGGTAGIGESATVTCTPASLIITGGTAGVNDDVTIIGTPANLTIAGVTASVANDVTVTGAAASLTITEQIATVIANSALATSAGASAISVSGTPQVDTTTNLDGARATARATPTSTASDDVIVAAPAALTITPLTAIVGVYASPASAGASAISVSAQTSINPATQLPSLRLQASHTDSIVYGGTISTALTFPAGATSKATDVIRPAEGTGAPNSAGATTGVDASTATGGGTGLPVSQQMDAAVGTATAVPDSFAGVGLPSSAGASIISREFGVEELDVIPDAAAATAAATLPFELSDTTAEPGSAGATAEASLPAYGGLATPQGAGATADNDVPLGTSVVFAYPTKIGAVASVADIEFVVSNIAIPSSAGATADVTLPEAKELVSGNYEVLLNIDPGGKYLRETAGQIDISADISALDIRLIRINVSSADATWVDGSKHIEVSWENAGTVHKLGSVNLNDSRLYLFDYTHIDSGVTYFQDLLTALQAGPVRFRVGIFEDQTTYSEPGKIDDVVSLDIKVAA